MYVPYESMPGHSRLWIYQADRPLTADEKKIVEAGLVAMCEQWAAHGTSLHTSYSIAWSQFILLTVDEHQNGASGCSIDSSVHYLQGLQKSLGINFFDRSRAAILHTEDLKTYLLTDLKTLFENRTLTGDDYTLNHLAGTKSEWEKNGKVRIKDSWLARYLPKAAVAK